MSKKKLRNRRSAGEPPRYELHAGTGKACIRQTINGKRQTIYLGAFNTPESRRAYHQVLRALERGADPRKAIDGQVRRIGTAKQGLTVAALCNRFLAHAERHYAHQDGTPTGEVMNFVYTMKPLLALCGDLEANAFKPSDLKVVREEMVSTGNALIRVQNLADVAGGGE